MPTSQLPTTTRAAILLTVVLILALPVNAQLGGLLSRRTKVPVITVEQVLLLQTEFDLKLKQADRTGRRQPKPSFIIVDVRTPDETKVSVIPGAITTKMYESEQDKYAGMQVIAYCTSGYRSDQYAAKLIERGILARNMKRSILGWCAAKLPLQTLDRRSTRRVHTYSSKNKVPTRYEQVW